jgi:multiple sugar transport system substrate-binding protein
MITRSITRRRLLQGSAALGGGALALSGKAPVYAQSKPLAGTTLNVSCWSAPYPKWLADYIPEFEDMTGAKVNYDTPSFPIYNQRVDLELSTQGSAYDVLNITFIYCSRWIGAGWFQPIEEYMKDPNMTPADWGADDFLAGVTAPMKDKNGVLYGIPWIADTFMAGCSRWDIFQEAGQKLPDTFDDVTAVCKAIHKKHGVPAYIAENHYGWTFIPWLMGFGGTIFRNPPDDLMPMLDTPEAAEAADFYANLLVDYGPDGALAYTYDQVVAALKAGRVNYSTNNQAFLVQMAAADSKVADKCNFAMMPAGPKGRFPGVASHAWGIPVGSKNKKAAWEFIKWAMSKDMVKRMLVEKGYGSITRRSLIDSPEFKKKLTINGVDVAKLYLDTIDLAAGGYMTYRTVHVYPQVDKQIDIAIQTIGSKQMSAADAMRRAQEASIADLKRAGIKL